jgi:RNA polymerase sigma-70 factor, ECF subfamily
MTPEELADEVARLHEDSFGWALSCSGWDQPMAEDVLQTAYLRLFSGKARFQGRSSFRTWLFGVIRRVAQEENRRSITRRDKVRELFRIRGDQVVEAEGLDRIARSEESRRLLEALNALPDRQREVLHLVFYEGLTVAEAGGVMEVSVGSARTHYDRGKKRMRVLLGEGDVGL